MSAVLTLDALSASYRTPRGRLPVLDAISLNVAHGELLAIIGPSGCGKTTLLHALAGLLPPTSGTLRCHGRVAMVFQRPTLMPWRTVLDNAAFGLECLGETPRATARARAAALLKRVGLGAHLDDRPHQLSEGMKQRVNLARALLINPDVLLLDEPFSALDITTRRALQDDLLALWRERSLTVVLVSHALDEVAYLADRVAVFSPRPARLLTLHAVDLPRPRAATLALHEEVARLEALLDNKEPTSHPRDDP